MTQNAGYPWCPGCQTSAGMVGCETHNPFKRADGFEAAIDDLQERMANASPQELAAILSWLRPLEEKLRQRLVDAGYTDAQLAEIDANAEQEAYNRIASPKSGQA